MSGRASTVIVGGGIVGAAVAYFLAERREKDVLLLERGELGGGTTAGGLGGIRHQFDDELDVRLSMLAMKTWRAFDELTGARHDFRRRGYLFLANTDLGLEQLRAAMPLYERVGVNVEMADRVAVAELVPGMRVDDVRGGRFGAEDGYGDPLQALAGFAAFARLAGVELRERTPVRELVRAGDRVTGVRTEAGEIAADRVLLATGCWTAPLAATAGVAVPIWPYRRGVMESQPIPTLADAPMVVEWESGFHFRPKGKAIRFAMPNLTADGRVEKAAGVTAAGVPRRVRATRGPARAGALGEGARGAAAPRFRRRPHPVELVLLLGDDARRPSDRRRGPRRRRPLHRGRLQRARLHARAGDRAAHRRGDARRRRARARHPGPLARAVPVGTASVRRDGPLNVRVARFLDGARGATGRTVIVDVYRAFTTAAFCVAAGAREIVLVSDHGRALAMKRDDPSLFLTGEIGGRPIPGFDVGNSPSAIEGRDLTGRRVVQRTSSGTQGVVAAAGADAVVLGSFVIAEATVRYLADRAGDVTVVAMGERGMLESSEDEACAAYIAARLAGGHPDVAAIVARLWEHENPEWPEWFPRRDAVLACEVDRFDFALPVSRVGDLLVARPVR